MIAVIDYGMGNVHSVHKALQTQGAQAVVTGEPDVIAGAQKIVLPGVGAFREAMDELRRRRLAGLLSDLIVRQGTPFLGICLGMQLLFEKSQEAGDTEGLGILRGEVVRFSAAEGLKIPHMGWNRIRGYGTSGGTVCPLFQGIQDGAYVYFCHSFYPKPAEESVYGCLTDYGVAFASCVWKDRIFGVQFHPEKSQTVGLRIIKNFVEMQAGEP